jgi:hypothetical protein
LVHSNRNSLEWQEERILSLSPATLKPPFKTQSIIYRQLSMIKLKI